MSIGTYRNSVRSHNRTLAIFVAAGLVEGIFLSHLFSFVPSHLLTLGVEQSEVARVTALISAIAGTAGIPFVAFWGALADRYSRKPIIIRSFLVLAICGIAMLTANQLWLFVLARALVPLSLGSTGLMLTTLSERLPTQRMGLAFTLVNGATPIGSFLGPMLGGALFDEHGMSWLLALDSAALACVVALLALGYRDDHSTGERSSLLKMVRESVASVLFSPRVRNLLVALTLVVSGWMAAYVQVPVAISQLYVGSSLGAAIGWVMAAAGLAALVISPSMGVLAGRIGVHRVMYGGIGILVLLFPLCSVQRNIVWLAALWAVVSGASAGVFSLGTLLLADSAPFRLRGRVMSFSFVPVLLGLSLGSLIASPLIRVSVFSVFPLASVLSLLGLAAVYWVHSAPVRSET
jgi:MFS transporter, DHA1 family, multidrug resistance protein